MLLIIDETDLGYFLFFTAECFFKFSSLVSYVFSLLDVIYLGCSVFIIVALNLKF